ncbi:MAG: C40 family peptidase [Eubacterium sp.]|nr:C40 family peptidase [Eubacterium sp.]
MIINSKVRSAVAVFGVFCIVFAAQDVYAVGTVRYMPDVTKEMSKASYWSDKVADSKRVLATTDEIYALDQEIYKTSLETRDMAAWSEKDFDARALVRALLSGAEADATYLWNVGARYYPDGSKAASRDDLYSEPISLCRDPSVDPDSAGEDTREFKFAVCTERTSLTVFPTDQPFQDDPDDPDFDYNYLTQVKVNEPVVLRTQSVPLEDGRFYYSARTMCGSGWIPADCVAVCKDKEEWLGAWNYPSDQLLVVLDDKIWTEESNKQTETARRKLPMGTRLQLATEEEAAGQIAGRTAHNNHVVWMPVRKSDGTYEKKLALIGENRKVSEGYPELTVENLMSVALNQLGDVYGWGSMLGTDDCSGYIRDVYSCFGLDMPRSTNRNNGVMKSYKLSDMSDSDKAAFIKTLPPGTDLTFSGHEMMYLGYEGDKIYVISSLGTMRFPGDDNITRIWGTVINTLDIRRRDDQTWLHHLNEAMVPFYSADHEDWVDMADGYVDAKGKTVKIKYSKLREKAQTVKRSAAIKITESSGKLTYSLKAVNKKKYKKYFKVYSTTGNIKVKKGLKKGTYRLTVRVTAADKNHTEYSDTVKVKIKVK